MGQRQTKKDFRFHVSRLCFTLTATLGDRGKESPYERLNTPNDLTQWLTQLGFSNESLMCDNNDLKKAKSLREAIQQVGEAMVLGQHFGISDIKKINKAASVEQPIPQLTLDGKNVIWNASKFESFLSMIARDFIDLATSPISTNVKICANPDCHGLFIDESRPKNRRWCSMQTCGNQMKKSKMKEVKTNK